MDYMARHGMKRARPAELRPGTVRVISARMDYQPKAAAGWQVIGAGGKAYIARYATGRDYHKVLRSRLEQLCRRIEREIGAFGYRVYTDSAPVLEAELAAKSGLGWRGKHTLLLSRDAGSYFFLGEIYTDLPLPVDAPIADALRQLQQVPGHLPDRAPSSRRTGSTPGAASPISLSNSKARSRWSCAR